MSLSNLLFKGDRIRCRKLFKLGDKMPIYATPGNDYTVLHASDVGVTFEGESGVQTEMWETMIMYFILPETVVNKILSTMEPLAYSRFNHRVATPNSDGITNYYFPWTTEEDAKEKVKNTTYPGAFVDVRTIDTPIDTLEYYERSNRITWGSHVKCVINPDLVSIFNDMKQNVIDVFKGEGPAKHIIDFIDNRGDFEGTLLQTITDMRGDKPFMTAIVASTDANGTTKAAMFSIMEVEEVEKEHVTIEVNGK
jgi:hypothetical protein